MRLHTYFRSSAAFRVRIALHLKGLQIPQVAHDLRVGAQSGAEYRKLNPQGLIPALETDEGVLIQSLAICEYLNERFPEPRLLPEDIMQRAKVRGFSQVIACDIHPVQNLRILKRLQSMGLDEDDVQNWISDWIRNGLDACEQLVDEDVPYCFGSTPTLADICLVPQLYNARRFKVQGEWPRLFRAETQCFKLPAFRNAFPEEQADYSP